MQDSVGARDADWLWSSANIPTDKALKETEELCAKLIADSRISAGSDRYRLDWRHYGLGPLGLNFLKGTPHRVVHTRPRASDARSSGFDVMVMRAGTAHVTHGNQVCELPPGTMILLDCAIPWNFVFSSDQDCLSAHMDAAWLRKWLPDPSALAGRAVNAAHPWAAPLVSMLNAIAADGLENAPMPRSLLADQMAGLLVLAVASRVDCELNHHGTELLKRIRGIIRDQFERVDLTALQVATDLGISRRHLDSVLAGARTTFLTLLEHQRLEAARMRLIDRCAKRQVAEIAWSCGFTDPGYFARRFRRSYGTSPTRFRSIMTDSKM
jgi:AraC-like DNA-binding protein